MKAYNKKRKPKHSIKVKYKKIYFKFMNRNCLRVKKDVIEKGKITTIYNNEIIKLD